MCPVPSGPSAPVSQVWWPCAPSTSCCPWCPVHHDSETLFLACPIFGARPVRPLLQAPNLLVSPVPLVLGAPRLRNCSAPWAGLGANDALPRCLQSSSRRSSLLVPFLVTSPQSDNLASIGKEPPANTESRLMAKKSQGNKRKYTETLGHVKPAETQGNARHAWFMLVFAHAIMFRLKTQSSQQKLRNTKNRRNNRASKATHRIARKRKETPSSARKREETYEMPCSCLFSQVPRQNTNFGKTAVRPSWILKHLFSQ